MGYGPIGITLAKLMPDTPVYMSDPNRPRSTWPGETPSGTALSTSGRLGGRVHTPSRSITFGAIVTNPPFRAGKRVVYALVSDAPSRLLPGGSFTCVAQTKQGAKSLRAHLEAVFGDVRELEKEGGYRVLNATLGSSTGGAHT